MKQFSTYCSLVITFFLVPSLAFAQKGNAKITGTVMDSVSGKPVEFANIALAHVDSNQPIDGAVADDKGEFAINKVAPGAYKLLITFIGFETRTINISIDEKNDDQDLGKITISPTPQVLKEVLVEGQKALIEERVDRTVYNAENDATAKGGDATDVLKRVPMLSVDLDGNVSLRGNQNILVLINNKPSTIMATSVSDALKQIPADQIKQVEVITSPSAKYDAEGSAGIINIITKKNTLEGATLNVDSGIGLRGSNLGLNGNFRRKKMGFSLGGWGRSNYNTKGRFENEQLTGEPSSSTLRDRSLQFADTRNNGLFGNYNLGWDYDINKKNVMSASVRFGVRNSANYQDDLTTQRFNASTNETTTTLGDVTSKDHSNSVDANLTYTHYYDKAQRELSFQGLYSRNNRNSNFQNFTKDESTFDIINRLKNLNDSYNQEITVQGDYVTPIGTMQMLELGAKNISRSVLSDFQTFAATGVGAPYVERTDETHSLNNNLNYSQNITAGYLAYTLNMKNNYSLKVGSRYEYTMISAYTQTVSEDEMKIPSYGVIVPSVNLSKRLKNGNTLKVSYNRRIQRPSIRYLNPNIQWQNNISFTEGNPTLRPEYTNNYEIGYSTLIKGIMLNMTGFARNTFGSIQSVRDYVTLGDTLQAIRTNYQNIGRENAYGTSIFANINVGKFSLNGGGDVYYATLNNNNPDERYKASNSGVVFSGRVFGSYNLKKGWGLQFFSFYRGRQVQLQGTQGGFYVYSLAIRKEFNEKRGSIGLGVENFLQKGIKIRTNLESPVLSQNSLNQMFNSSIRLNFSYRIGKMGVDSTPRRRRSSINNDDLKEGGDGGMGGMGGGGDAPQQRGGGQGGFSPRGNTQPQGQRPQASVPATAPASSDTLIYNATGTWSYTIESPQGGSGTIVLNQTDGVYSATIKTNRMSQETAVQNLKVEGNNVSFSYTVNFGGNSSTIEVAYRISKDTISGTYTAGQWGSFPLNGQRSN